MSFRPIYEGWDIPSRLSRKVRSRFAGIGLNRDLVAAEKLADDIGRKLEASELASAEGQHAFAKAIALDVMEELGADDPDGAYAAHLTETIGELIGYEGWFALPDVAELGDLARSELWQLEDHLKRVEAIIDHLGEVHELATAMFVALLRPIVEQQDRLVDQKDQEAADITFPVHLMDVLRDRPALVEHMMQVPFAPDLEPLQLTPRLCDRLEYNLHVASGGVPGDPNSVRQPKLPTKQSGINDDKIIATYLDGTPLLQLLDFTVAIDLPQATRFEHMHIVAGSGHGKTQTLQQLILHDLDAVAAGEASIIVIDSQSDLINNIAGLEMFAPGQPLSDRLVLIDPTDIEYPTRSTASST